MLSVGSGLLVGHWTDELARTGCTVVLLPEGTVASGEIRGGAPASRDFALLAPERTVQGIDAVVLAGGSAFGLAAADGVMAWCGEHSRGFQTSAGKVPIVVGLALYDLAQGDATVRPGREAGYMAARNASEQWPSVGRVGVGAGATMNKWRGPQYRKSGGVSAALVEVGEVKVTALIAVNSSGDLNDGSVVADLVAGTYEHHVVDPFAADPLASDVDDAGAVGPVNTTIGVVVTNAVVDKLGCYRLARSGHAGMARALFPAHTASDGDALVIAATGELEVPRGLLEVMTAAAVEQAIRTV